MGWVSMQDEQSPPALGSLRILAVIGSLCAELRVLLFSLGGAVRNLAQRLYLGDVRHALLPALAGAGALGNADAVCQ